MKTLRFLALISLNLCCWLAHPAGVEPVPPNEAAIRTAMGDKSQAARVSWWGFNPEDSTEALQAAIDSGVSQLIIEDMGAPWVTDKISLASDQEIIFEKGVEVIAKRGAFQRPNDALFSAGFQKNITLTGDDATLRMWKKDYADPAKYRKAEWRNVITLRSCSNVRITGLTLADSGGDGIYLGSARAGVPCSDVVIKNVTCANNYRQGISVISARNLLIEDCVLRDTSGTAPESGIDFEPNKDTEELTNCVMRNCVTRNNRGRGYLFALPYLRETSAPLSIRIENCRSIGDLRSLEFITANKPGAASVTGEVFFTDCRFERSRDTAILIRDKTVRGARLTLENCEIIQPAREMPGTTPVQFAGNALGADTFGGIHFKNLRLEDPVERLPMSYEDFSGGVGLADITGTVHLSATEGKDVAHELTPELIAKWMPFRSFKTFGQPVLEDPKFEPFITETGEGISAVDPARQRGLSEWLIWAEAKQKAAFDVLIVPVGKGEPRAVPVSLVSPSGEVTRLADSPGPGETRYEFTARERGAYKVVCEALNWTATVNSASERVCLYSQSSAFHLIGTVGEYFFQLPPGTEAFGIKVSGGGGTEKVAASLVDSKGEIIESIDNISQAHQFLGQTAAEDRPGIWSLRIARPSEGVMEDFHVQLQGIPAVLANTHEDLLLPIADKSEAK